MRRRTFLLGSSIFAAAAGAKPPRARSATFFIGTQAATSGHGIKAARLDEETGAIELLNGVTEVAQPTWLLADPVRPVLYAVSEIGYSPGQRGEILSFATDSNDGRLTPISRLASGGSGPVFIGSDRSASTLFVANYGDGRVAAFPVDADGTLSGPTTVVQGSGGGPDPRQNGPHAHAAVLDPSGRFLVVPDLGADRIFVYRFDVAKRSLVPAAVPELKMPAGSGPRHLVFASDGRAAFVLTELTATIHGLDWNSLLGTFTAITATALDQGVLTGTRNGGEIAISPDGRFIYASNRATSAIQVFGVHPANRTLHLVQSIGSGGRVPWSFAFSPSRSWLIVANQGSDEVTSFRVNPSTGMLAPSRTSLTVTRPVTIAFTA